MTSHLRMTSCSSFHILLISLAFLSCLCQVWAIECMICQDCAEPKTDANSTRTCGKKEDRCVKMILTNDEVDRGCSDTARCTGRVGAPTRKPRSLSKKSKPEELTNNAPKQRTIRQLLAPPSKGGDGKNPSIEIKAMFCCDTDSCNGGASALTFNYYRYFLLPLLAFIYYYPAVSRFSLKF